MVTNDNSDSDALQNVVDPLDHYTPTHVLSLVLIFTVTFVIALYIFNRDIFEHYFHKWIRRPLVIRLHKYPYHLFVDITANPNNGHQVDYTFKKITWEKLIKITPPRFRIFLHLLKKLLQVLDKRWLFVLFLLLVSYLLIY